MFDNGFSWYKMINVVKGWTHIKIRMYSNKCSIWIEIIGMEPTLITIQYRNLNKNHRLPPISFAMISHMSCI